MDHEGDNPEPEAMSEPVENQGGVTNSRLTPGAEAAPGIAVKPASATVSGIRSSLVKPLSYASCGMEFVAAVGIFAFGGLWLDRRFDLLPAFTLVGFGIGLSLGFLSLYKTVYRLGLQNAREEAEAESKPRRPPMKGSGLELEPEVTRPGRDTELPAPEPKRERPFIRRRDEP